MLQVTGAVGNTRRFYSPLYTKHRRRPGATAQSIRAGGSAIQFSLRRGVRKGVITRPLVFKTRSAKTLGSESRIAPRFGAVSYKQCLTLPSHPSFGYSFRLASPSLPAAGTGWELAWLGKAFGKATGRVLRQGVCRGPSGYVPRVLGSGSVRACVFLHAGRPIIRSSRGGFLSLFPSRPPSPCTSLQHKGPAFA